MNRMQKRFAQKVSRPILTTLAILSAAITTHYIATLFGYTLAHVIAYVGILFAYLLVPTLIAGGLIFAFGLYMSDKWREAKSEVAQENGELIEVIRND